jgi:peptidoglycan/xylan/chitin deacetylase (PgdA/CDA1 family)
VRAEARIGALGDHTWHHLDLTRLTQAQRRAELLSTRRAIASAAGVRVMLMRPPYGARNRQVDALARRLGMLDVLWSIDSRDSEGASWQQILTTVVADLRPGAIILFHENHGQTLKAVHRLLPVLRRRRLRAVSVPELLALDPPSLAQVRLDARGAPRRGRARGPG